MKTLASYCAEILKLLGQPTRINIIEKLRDAPSGELFVSEISSQTGEEQSNTSRHLSLMVANGILLNRKEVPKCLYKIKGPEILEILNLAAKASQGVSAADTLKALGQAERIKIAEVLGDKELSASEISSAINGKQSNTSRHLTFMVENGLLTNRREGAKSLFAVRSPEIMIIIETVKRVMELETRQRQEQILSGCTL